MIGCKKDSVKIVYTSYLNLKKTGAMDVGQVGFVDEKKVNPIRVASIMKSKSPL
jgi:hypothetical protein